jgi:hypothetical protein
LKIVLLKKNFLNHIFVFITQLVIVASPVHPQRRITKRRRRTEFANHPLNAAYNFGGYFCPAPYSDHPALYGKIKKNK